MSAHLEVTAFLEEGYRCTVPVRQFRLTADEPPSSGGGDRGPMPTELLLASLASCFAMAVAYVARREGVSLPDLAVKVRGEYEGMRFARIRVEVDAGLPDRERLRRLVERAVRYCYVSNTLMTGPQLSFGLADPEAPLSP
ncbi:MAG TPA: OsmC family protein [Candidatus Dormibacteraeota bacterium]|jgi:putative redox protein|nr:OsmC family protein [Candidatus Dormibacteraeota bacterium]